MLSSSNCRAAMVSRPGGTPSRVIVSPKPSTSSTGPTVNPSCWAACIASGELFTARISFGTKRAAVGAKRLFRGRRAGASSCCAAASSAGACRGAWRAEAADVVVIIVIVIVVVVVVIVVVIVIIVVVIVVRMRGCDEKLQTIAVVGVDEDVRDEGHRDDGHHKGQNQINGTAYEPARDRADSSKRCRNFHHDAFSVSQVPRAMRPKAHRSH